MCVCLKQFLTMILFGTELDWSCFCFTSICMNRKGMYIMNEYFELNEWKMTIRYILNFFLLKIIFVQCLYKMYEWAIVMLDLHKRWLLSLKEIIYLLKVIQLQTWANALHIYEVGDFDWNLWNCFSFKHHDFEFSWNRFKRYFWGV